MIFFVGKLKKYPWIWGDLQVVAPQRTRRVEWRAVKMIMMLTSIGTLVKKLWMQGGVNATQARAGDFPQGGGENSKWKILARAIFFAPPEKFSPTLRGGGEIFPEGGENPEESYKIGARRAPKIFLGKFCSNIGHQGLRPPWASSVMGDAPLGMPRRGRNSRGGGAPPEIPGGGNATPAPPCTPLCTIIRLGWWTI